MTITSFAKPDAHSSTGKAKILIAEDDPVFRHLLQFTLTRAGHQVIVAQDGEMAYRRWLDGDINVVVTDHQMPRCTGLELIDRMEAHLNNLDEMPAVIFCTAKGLELDRQSLFSKSHVRDVIAKPFSPRQLTRRIDEVLSAISEVM
ncbi:MAG: response regulator [Planctomycetota bacterium]